MKKIFGFFSDHKKRDRLFKIIVVILSLALIVSAGFLIGQGFTKDKNLLAISKNLNHYEIELTYVDNHCFEASQTIEVKNTSDDVWEVVKFNLYPNAFAEGVVNKPVSTLNVDNAYPNGMSYGGIAFDTIMVEGATAEWDTEGIDHNALVVVLPQALKTNDSVEISMDYNLTLPNINHRFGYGDNAINMGNFYPVLAVYENGDFVCDPYHYNGDPFYSEMSNYHVTLSVPLGYTVAHTGTELSQSNSNDVTTYQIKALAVRDFAFVMSDQFHVLNAQAGKTDVSYYYYADDDAAKSLLTAQKSIETFSDLFGTYPYDTYSVVQTNFMHGGMEYPNLCYISDAVTKQSDYLNVIVHETAHQWWYQLVGSNAFEYPWLDEGLTEYSTILFYKKNTDYGVNTEELLANATQSYVSFVELCESVLGEVDTSMNRALDEYDTEPEYVYMTYVKGMLMFDALRSLIGQTSFERALKNYVTAYAFENVTPDLMVSEFEQASMRSLTSFFESWTKGKVILMPLN